MPLTIWNCVCHMSKTIILLENSLLFQEISFITDSQVATVLLPTFLPDGKLGFWVANLLLATVNFKP